LEVKATCFAAVSRSILSLLLKIFLQIAHFLIIIPIFLSNLRIFLLFFSLSLEEEEQFEEILKESSNPALYDSGEIIDVSFSDWC